MAVAKALPSSQQTRTKAQTPPDAPFEPRKNKRKMRDKNGRIKR